MIELRVNQLDFQNLSSLEQIDVVCDAFEMEWRAGNVRPIEQYVELVDPILAAALLRELALLQRDCEAAIDSSNRGISLETKVDLQDTNSDHSQPYLIALPRRFENYILLEQVGRGASGVVYLAEDIDLGNQVAIKLPHRHFLSDPDDHSNFLREARHAARLSHPGIIRILRVGVWQSTPFIVSEFVRGTDLKIWLQQSDRRITHHAAARLMADLAEAVHHAHSFGVIHRDLKPSNIMVQEATTDSPSFDRLHDELLLKPYVLDFGISKLLGSSTCNTQQGHMLGTPAYMSPEQANGDALLADSRSDVYSLGVIMYELLCGTTPHTGNVNQVLERIRSSNIVPVLTRDPEIPRSLAAICHQCLQDKPDDRYATASGLAIDLQRWLNGKPVEALLHSRKNWLARNGAISFMALPVTVLLACVALASTKPSDGARFLRGLFARHDADSREIFAERLSSVASNDTASMMARVTQASPSEIVIVATELGKNRDQSIAELRTMRSTGTKEFPEDEEGERCAEAQAKIVLAQYALGDVENVWSVFRAGPDPRIRTYFHIMHRYPESQRIP